MLQLFFRVHTDVTLQKRRLSNKGGIVFLSNFFFFSSLYVYRFIKTLQTNPCVYESLSRQVMLKDVPTFIKFGQNRLCHRLCLVDFTPYTLTLFDWIQNNFKIIKIRFTSVDIHRSSMTKPVTSKLCKGVRYLYLMCSNLYYIEYNITVSY